MKCTSMRKLVLARTVQHRATRQASIDTDCAAPWKMTHSWRHVARRAACGGLHLSVHKKLMNCTSMRQLVLTRTVQHRATRQASIDTDCAAPWNVTHSWRHVAGRAACGVSHLPVPAESCVTLVANAGELAGVQVVQENFFVVRQLGQLFVVSVDGRVKSFALHECLSSCVGVALQNFSLLRRLLGHLQPLLGAVRSLLLLPSPKEALHRFSRLCSTEYGMLNGC
jgi:hypothetical protein